MRGAEPRESVREGFLGRGGYFRAESQKANRRGKVFQAARTACAKALRPEGL